MFSLLFARHGLHPTHGRIIGGVAMVVAGFGLWWWSARVALPQPLPAVGLAWALIVAGALVSGFLAGLLGIGGALVTVPTFYAVLPMLGTAATDLPAAVAASALMAMVPTTLAAARRQHAHGALHVVWLKRLALPMVIGAVAGVLLASRTSGSLLGWTFAAQGIYYGGRLLVDHRDDGGAAPRGLTVRLCGGPAWITGVGMSAFCAWVGTGGGSVVVPFLRHRGLALRSAVATASTLNLCIAFGGTGSIAFAAASGSPVAGLHYPAALALGLIAVVAAPFGVTLSHALPAKLLRGMIGAVNVLAAVTLALQLVICR